MLFYSNWLHIYFIISLSTGRGGTSWPWSHSSWIYNYLCNQCLSPLMLWVRISIRARCTTLCDNICQWLATCWWLSPGPPVSSTNKTDRHDTNWNIVESGVKHHQTNKQTNKQTTYFIISLSTLLLLLLEAFLDLRRVSGWVILTNIL